MNFELKWVFKQYCYSSTITSIRWKICIIPPFSMPLVFNIFCAMSINQNTNMILTPTPLKNNPSFNFIWKKYLCSCWIQLLFITYYDYILSMCSPFYLPTVCWPSTFPIYHSQNQRKYHYSDNNHTVKTVFSIQIPLPQFSFNILSFIN